MLFDLPPDPPKFWLPPKPAIIRGAPDLVVPKREPLVRDRRRGSGPILTWISGNSDTTNTASRTFTAQNIGAAHPRRLVVVCVGGGESNAGGNSQFTGVTIGGNAATIHVNPGGGREPSAIASLLVTSGTTADIVTTRTGATGPHHISVYTLLGYQSETPTDTDGVNSSTAGQTSRTATLDIPANGVALYSLTKGDTGTPTWSTATEDYFSNSPDYVSSASKRAVTTLLAHAEVASFASTYAGICGAAWR